MGEEKSFSQRAFSIYTDIRKLQDKAKTSYTGCDIGEIVYVDYEGMEENPSNYYDIMAVYMVKYGVGDTATVINDTSKGWLQSVVNDMCSYTTSTGTKDVEETDDEGNVTTVTKSVLYVNVTLKSYRDMISMYGFNSDQVEMLEQIMSPDFMGQLGYAGSGSGGGGGSPGVSSMTEDEINAILSGITDSRQKTVCSYALHRVGYPYSQDFPCKLWDAGEKGLTLSAFEWEKDRKTLIYGQVDYMYGEALYKPEMKEGNPIRLYSLDEITEIFCKLGLRICNIFADFSGKPSSDNDIQLMVYSIRE